MYVCGFRVVVEAHSADFNRLRKSERGQIESFCRLFERVFVQSEKLSEFDRHREIPRLYGAVERRRGGARCGFVDYDRRVGKFCAVFARGVGHAASDDYSALCCAYQIEFCAEIFLHVFVPVEVVGRKIRPQQEVGAQELQVGGLETAKLADCGFLGVAPVFGAERAKGRAYVARRKRIAARDV